MGKAVFLNVSGGGHVIATYGMVGELVSRGEEIIYYESPRFKEEIEALGAVFRPYPDIQPYEGPMVDYPYHHELGLAVMLTWCSLEWIPKLIDEIRELKPDYIVHDSLCLWGRIIAGILKVPAICSIHTPAFTWRVVLANRGYWMDMPEMFFKSLKCIAATTMSLAVNQCSISTGRLARKEQVGAWPCDFKPFKALTY